MSDATPLEDYLTPLVPVSEWKWFLYRVDYFYRAEDTKPLCTRYFVSTDTHIDYEIQEHSPSGFWTRYQEVEICEVSRPRQVGWYRGQRLDETAREAGLREARERGLT